MHTKGQLELTNHYDDTVTILDENGFQLITVDDTSILLGYADILDIDHWAHDKRAYRYLEPGEQEANARRIVALWNMADRLNLSTEFIEDGGVEEMAEFIDTIERIAAKSNIPLMQHEARRILSKMGR